MLRTDREFNIEGQALYNGAERVLSKRPNFRIVDITDNTMIRVTGRRDYTPIYMLLALAFGVFLFFLLPIIGIIVFIIIAAVYFTSKVNTLQIDISDLGGGRSRLTMRTEGREAAVLSSLLLDRLSEFVKHNSASTPAGIETSVEDESENGENDTS